MSPGSLGKLMYVRRVVDDYPSAFAFYLRFMQPTTVADLEQFEEQGYVRLWNCTPTERLEVELVARDRFPDLLGTARRAEDGTLVFGVDDVDAAVEGLRRGGVEIVVEPQEHAEWNVRFAQARDPSGGLVELSVARGSWGSLLTAAP